jgi:hypothetical protein
MGKIGRHFRVWLAPVAVSAAALGLAVPAQAQASLPSRAASTPVTATQSLQSLVGHAPAGGKRWIVNDPVAYGQAVKSKAWVRTPSGLSDTGCVFHVPDHATVTNGLIRLPSGATHQMKPCEYPTLAYPGAAAAGPAEPSATKPAGSEPRATESAAGGPCYFGSGSSNVYWVASCYGAEPTWATSMVQEQAVPSDPAQDGALIFLWGGLTNLGGGTLLQVVLTWGANGNIVTNPNIWYVTPWYLWSGNSVTGASIHVGVADTIVQSLTGSDCDSSGDCTWVLASTDKTNGRSTSYTVTSGVPFEEVLGAVMEVPRADGCVETPASGHAAFRDLVMTGNTGTITPDFGTSVVDSQCSVSMTQSASGADILWKP